MTGQDTKRHRLARFNSLPSLSTHNGSTCNYSQLQRLLLLTPLLLLLLLLLMVVTITRAVKANVGMYW